MTSIIVYFLLITFDERNDSRSARFDDADDA